MIPLDEPIEVKSVKIQFTKSYHKGLWIKKCLQPTLVQQRSTIESVKRRISCHCLILKCKQAVLLCAVGVIFLYPV